MRVSSLIFGAAFVLAPTVALAEQEWTLGMARGLTTYAAEAGGGSVVMVCDPDRVYNPDVSYANFVVTMPSDQRAEQIVFLAATGQQAAFAVRDGTATQQDADPEAWEALVTMIENGGQFAVVTSRDTFSLDMAPLPSFECS